MTKTSAAALKGMGLMGVARDNLPRDGQTYSFMVAFAEVEVDVETGVYRIVDYAAMADVGTVMHPSGLGGQIQRRRIQGIGHVRSQKMVYDPHYGALVGKRLHHHKPPTILDMPETMAWGAVERPTRATRSAPRASASRRLARAAAVIMCALADAVGDGLLTRTPVHPEMIASALQTGKPHLRAVDGVHLGGLRQCPRFAT